MNAASKPDLFTAGDNLRAAAKQAECWIAHLNALASAMEGRARGYLDTVRTLPSSPQTERLIKSMEFDLKAIEDLRNQGPIIPS